MKLDFVRQKLSTNENLTKTLKRQFQEDVFDVVNVVVVVVGAVVVDVVVEVGAVVDVVVDTLDLRVKIILSIKSFISNLVGHSLSLFLSFSLLITFSYLL